MSKFTLSLVTMTYFNILSRNVAMRTLGMFSGCLVSFCTGFTFLLAHWVSGLTHYALPGMAMFYHTAVKFSVMMCCACVCVYSCWQCATTNDNCRCTSVISMSCPGSTSRRMYTVTCFISSIQLSSIHRLSVCLSVSSWQYDQHCKLLGLIGCRIWSAKSVCMDM